MPWIPDYALFCFYEHNLFSKRIIQNNCSKVIKMVKYQWFLLNGLYELGRKQQWRVGAAYMFADIVKFFLSR